MEQVLSALLIVLFIGVPGAVVYLFLSGAKNTCHHLSDTQFFKAPRDSVAVPLLWLLCLQALIEIARYVTGAG